MRGGGLSPLARRPLIIVLPARQVLQGALIVGWRDPTRLPAHLFSSSCLLLGSSLPFVCVEKVLGVGRTRDAIRGGDKLWCPLVGGGDKWTGRHPFQWPFGIAEV